MSRTKRKKSVYQLWNAFLNMAKKIVNEEIEDINIEANFQHQLIIAEPEISDQSILGMIKKCQNIAEFRKSILKKMQKINEQETQQLKAQQNQELEQEEARQSKKAYGQRVMASSFNSGQKLINQFSSLTSIKPQPKLKEIKDVENDQVEKPQLKRASTSRVQKQKLEQAQKASSIFSKFRNTLKKNNNTFTKDNYYSQCDISVEQNQQQPNIEQQLTCIEQTPNKLNLKCSKFKIQADQKAQIEDQQQKNEETS
eukprot:TRINITY_DN16271_c0_g1_i3.p2 TRINITY_DN16271_c0_g1~~TRINITY_DN16271_c0_g1_i3.p2  ORF type:complete len:255 (+),score=49.30 TRINITY_DN16271_c0_g1_i3:1051-1815(+)